MPKPRRFHHTCIYVDERKERLERLRGKVREEGGGTTVRPEEIRGKFVEQTTHLRRRKARGTRPWHPVILLFLIALLGFLWYVLAGGTM